MIQPRLTETADYTAKREKLRQAELELMQHAERVAALRRELPTGSAVGDYVFQETDAPASTVAMSDLFASPTRPLVIYHLMYGKAQTTPCPMCTMWVDGFNGVAQHLAQNVNFAVAAAAGPAELRAHGRARGWDRLRLLSCAGNTFKYDLGSENEAGEQFPMISVFTLDAGRTPHHSYSMTANLSDEINERGIDLLSPVWNVLDLTPQGRGDWYAKLDYSVGAADG